MTTTFNININKTKTILAGPWVGEFGWELFCWQGYIRYISEEYKNVIVVSRKGHEFLYEDFTKNFISINLPANSSSNSWFCDGVTEHYLNDFIKNIKHDIRVPAINLGFYLYDDGSLQTEEKYNKQKFVKYNSNTIDKHFDILIHPRNKSLGNERNWNSENWQTLIDQLKNDFTIAVIGNHETFMLNDVEDYRNISIRDTVSLMNRCKLVVGQSSGPMHLASLSGTPHLVWSSEHNRNRYLKYWNPFNTPVYFFSEMSWNPSVEFIYNKIIENIKK